MTLYIGSEIYRHSTYGSSHPLAVPRVSTVTDLCRALAWLTDADYRDAPMATEAEVCRFHDSGYVAALRRAEATQSVSDEDRALYRIGAEGNPVYREIFRRPMTSAGGVMLAARLTAPGGTVYCPGGGTHHGRPARASGFCYLNDPVLGILTWLDAGLERIVYLDIDAHHGDGVQDAFADDARVLTLSVHEAGRWPHSGLAADRAGGAARNFPVPAGFNDTEMRLVVEAAILPLAKLSLSNNAHWAVVDAVRHLAPRLVVTGGGGYNPYTVGRCWAGVWATLNDIPIPARTTPAAESVLRALTYNRAAGRNPPEHWFTTLRDPRREGTVGPEIRQLVAGALEAVPA